MHQSPINLSVFVMISGERTPRLTSPDLSLSISTERASMVPKRRRAWFGGRVGGKIRREQILRVLPVSITLKIPLLHTYASSVSSVPLNFQDGNPSHGRSLPTTSTGLRGSSHRSRKDREVTHATQGTTLRVHCTTVSRESPGHFRL